MKKVLIVGILLLFSCVSIFAQNWTVEPYVNFWNSGWDNADTTTTFSVDLTVGYYIAEDLNIGLSGYFSKPADGSTIGIGPRVKYDFLKFERIYFSLLGSLIYERHSGSYYLDERYYDANCVILSLDPAVVFVISQNIEVYWDFATAHYTKTWLTYKGYDRSYQHFGLSGPWIDPEFGLVFRF